MLEANCDFPTCSNVQTWDNSNVEYAECPEGWGALILSDSAGELQSHWVCPEHVHLAWELLKPSSPAPTSHVNSNCVVCLAMKLTSSMSSVEEARIATLTLIRLVHQEEIPIGQVVSDLCFTHRRQLTMHFR